MATKFQIIKLFAFIAFILFLISLLLNVYISQSYYFARLNETSNDKHISKIRPNLKQINKDFKLNKSKREPFTDQFFSNIQKEIPSLPIEYFHRHANQVMQKFKNCAQYPAIQMLNFYNTYWQTFHIDNSIYQLYGAYYDNRPSTGPVIRILTMTNQKLNKFPTIYCQLWYENDNRPVLSTIKEYQLIWDTNWGVIPNVYYPYLMTCEVPKNYYITGDSIPKVVNLVAQQCDTAKNSLRIVYNQLEANEKKQKFSVCVKGLDYPYQDLSSRLVEWLELLKIMGIHKVFMHNIQVHSNVSKVLDYYQGVNFVEVKNITLVGGVVGLPQLEHWLIKSFPLNKRLNELIPYNDCFYRNIYKYEYIAFLDIDEIIVPKGRLINWHDILRKFKTYKQFNNSCQEFPSICFSNVYFPHMFKDHQVPISAHPLFLHMVNHPYRLKDSSVAHHHVKCLHNTQLAVTLHNHYPLTFLKESCTNLDVNTSYAQLQHYRDVEANSELATKPQKFIKEDNLKRFCKPLLDRCTKVLKDLKLIN